MIKSRQPLRAGEILVKFAEMAERSRAPDGDWQGDGWGVGWLDEGGSWRVRKSLKPVWKEKDALRHFPASSFFLGHARSASFSHQRDVLEYNQPYIKDAYGFVFNGLLEGVAFPLPVVGRIGSQKIWGLLSAGLGWGNPEESLMELAGKLVRYSRRVQALNIGLGGQGRLYAYCRYEGDGVYYQLQFHNSPELQIVCSEALAGFDFQPIPRDRILRL